MKTIVTQSTGVDRSKWAPGPWDGEPDKTQWMTKAGLPGLAVRSRLGNWCGYVGVPEGHLVYENDYENVDADVHGGLTYSGKCAGNICHEVEHGDAENVWWLGFDCAHLYDRVPGREAFDREHGFITDPYDTYRNLFYVRTEVETLAEQLAAMVKT